MKYTPEQLGKLRDAFAGSLQATYMLDAVAEFGANETLEAIQQDADRVYSALHRILKVNNALPEWATAAQQPEPHLVGDDEELPF